MTTTVDACIIAALETKLQQAERVAEQATFTCREEHEMRIAAEDRLAKVPALIEAARLLPKPLYNGNQSLIPDIVLERIHVALADYERETA